MKPLAITFCLSAASLAPMWASITINTEFGQLRNASDAVITGLTTYAIVYDTNNDSSMPGGLGVNDSLTVGDSAMAFAAFAGKTLSQGLTIGGDTVVKWGTFKDAEGVATPALESADFTASGGLTETLGYDIVFIGFRASQRKRHSCLADRDREELMKRPLIPAIRNHHIGMQIPADGFSYTTAIRGLQALVAK